MRQPTGMKTSEISLFCLSSYNWSQISGLASFIFSTFYRLWVSHLHFALWSLSILQVPCVSPFRPELVVRNRCQKPVQVKIGAHLWPPEITSRTSSRPPMEQQGTHQRIRFESMPYFVVLYGYFVGKQAAFFSKGSCRWAEFSKTGQFKVYINILYVEYWMHAGSH